MLGNVKALIASISTVIVFTLLLVTGGTMSMAIRERRREVALLKALGFGGRLVFGLLLAESLGLALAGAALGGWAAWFALQTVNIQQFSHGLFVSFAVTPQMLGRGLLMACALGVVSCLWPAWGSVRQSVAAGLRFAD
jgi:putative ABC transport system permease protein